MKKRKRSLILTIGICLVLGTAGSLLAQSNYPSRTVEIVIPAGTGGGMDTMVRFIQPLLEKELGTSIRVSNVPGGGHTKGILYSNTAPADGYTVHLESGSGVIADVFNKIPVKFHEAFVPICTMQKDTGILWTGKKGRFKTIKEMIDYAKKNPGKLTVAISSAGGIDDASVGNFTRLAGVTVKLVPIKSGGERIAFTIAGHVDFLYEEATAVGDLMKSGKVVPLVVFKDKRINTPEFKDVPCAGELGYKGMDALGTWRAFFVKKGTPQPIMDKLTGAFRRVYDSPTYQKYAKDNLLDITPGWLGPEDTAKLVKDCTKIYADVFKQLGRLK